MDRSPLHSNCVSLTLMEGVNQEGGCVLVVTTCHGSGWKLCAGHAGKGAEGPLFTMRGALHAELHPQLCAHFSSALKNWRQFVSFYLLSCV